MSFATGQLDAFLGSNDIGDDENQRLFENTELPIESGDMIQQALDNAEDVLMGGDGSLFMEDDDADATGLLSTDNDEKKEHPIVERKNNGLEKPDDSNSEAGTDSKNKDEPAEKAEVRRATTRLKTGTIQYKSVVQKDEQQFNERLPSPTRTSKRMKQKKEDKEKEDAEAKTKAVQQEEPEEEIEEVDKEMDEEMDEDEEEEDPNALYCVCQKPYKAGQIMIMCESCENWFHPRCVSLDKRTTKILEDSTEPYFCPTCQEIAGGAVAKPQPKSKTQDKTKPKPRKPRKRKPPTVRVVEKDVEEDEEEYIEDEDKSSNPRKKVRTKPKPKLPTCQRKACSNPVSDGKFCSAACESKYADEQFQLLLGESSEPIEKSTKKVAQDTKRNDGDSVREYVRDTLTNVLQKRCDCDPRYEEIDCRGLAFNIEHELFEVFEETNSHYKKRFRNINFNLRDSKNVHLFSKVASKEITPAQLVKLSPQEMAVPQLKEEREALAKKSLDDYILQPSQMQVVVLNKKYVDRVPDLPQVPSSTSQGKEDEDMGEVSSDDEKGREKGQQSLNSSLNLSSVTNNSPAKRASMVVGQPLSRQSSITEEAASPTKRDEDQKSEKAPDESHQADDVQEEKQEAPPTARMAINLPTRVFTAPEPEPEAVEMDSPAQSPLDISVSSIPVWTGTVSMSHMTTTSLVAYRMYGSVDDDDFYDNVGEEWSMKGRIGPAQVWDYLDKLKFSSSKKIIVIRLEPSSEDERVAYISWYEYLSSRRRFAVVAPPQSSIKDCYLVTIPSNSEIPEVFKDMQGPGLANCDDERRLVAVMVVSSGHSKSRRRSKDRRVTQTLENTSPYSITGSDKTSPTIGGDEPYDPLAGEEPYEPFPSKPAAVTGNLSVQDFMNVKSFVDSIKQQKGPPPAIPPAPVTPQHRATNDKWQPPPDARGNEYMRPNNPPPRHEDKWYPPPGDQSSFSHPQQHGYPYDRRGPPPGNNQYAPPPVRPPPAQRDNSSFGLPVYPPREYNRRGGRGDFRGRYSNDRRR